MPGDVQSSGWYPLLPYHPAYRGGLKTAVWWVKCPGHHRISSTSPTNRTAGSRSRICHSLPRCPPGQTEYLPLKPCTKAGSATGSSYAKASVFNGQTDYQRGHSWWCVGPNVSRVSHTSQEWLTENISRDEEPLGTKWRPQKYQCVLSVNGTQSIGCFSEFLTTFCPVKRRTWKEAPRLEYYYFFGFCFFYTLGQWRI